MSKILELIQHFVHLTIGGMIRVLNMIHPTCGLIVVSLLMGLLLVFLYRFVSFQKAVKSIKNGIHGSLLESILFRHDLFLSLRAQGRMFLQGITYLLLAVPPLLVLALPCIIVMSELNLWYGSRPLRVNESSIVRLRVNQPSQLLRISLSSSPDLDVTPPLRVRETGEVFWRVTPKKEGTYPITLEASQTNFHYPIIAQDFHDPIISSISRSWWSKVLAPSPETELPPLVQEMNVQYPERTINMYIGSAHWVVVFFVLSLMSGFLGSKIFGVEL